MSDLDVGTVASRVLGVPEREICRELGCSPGRERAALDERAARVLAPENVEGMLIERLDNVGAIERGSTPKAKAGDVEALKLVAQCRRRQVRTAKFILQRLPAFNPVYEAASFPLNWRTRMRIPIILAVAALVLSSCNANREVNLSSQTASEVFAGHYVVDNPYDPVSYAQNHTGWGGR